MKAGRWEGLTPAARAVLFSRPEADRTVSGLKTLQVCLRVAFPSRQEEKRFSRSQSWGGAAGGQRQGQLSHEKLREVSVSPTLAWRHFLCISQIPLSFLTSAAYRLGVGSRSLCPQGGNRRHYALVQICWGLRGGEGLTLFLVLLDTSTQVTILHRLTGERGAGHTCG